MVSRRNYRRLPTHAHHTTADASFNRLGRDLPTIPGCLQNLRGGAPHLPTCHLSTPDGECERVTATSLPSQRPATSARRRSNATGACATVVLPHLFPHSLHSLHLSLTNTTLPAYLPLPPYSHSPPTLSHLSSLPLPPTAFYLRHYYYSSHSAAPHRAYFLLRLTPAASATFYHAVDSRCSDG